MKQKIKILSFGRGGLEVRNVLGTHGTIGQKSSGGEVGAQAGKVDSGRRRRKRKTREKVTQGRLSSDISASREVVNGFKHGFATKNDD